MDVHKSSRERLQFADIIINHAFCRIQGALTYAVSKNLKIEVGSLVIVPFRNQKKTGVVIKIHEKKPNFPIKEIEKICLEKTVMLPWQMSLFSWMQEYYFSDPYRTAKLFLPEKIFKGKISPGHSEPIFCHSERRLRSRRPASGGRPKNLTPNPLPTAITPNQNTTLIYHHDMSESRFEKYAAGALSEWQEGKQTLLLTAEISMAETIAEICQKYFQEKIMIFESNVSEKNKADTWQEVRNGKTPMVIGSRSALFLPFKKLGLIIIDQEHDLISYKQEQTPMYSAKTVAEKIVKFTGAKLILASHAPSIESMHLRNSANAEYLCEKNEVSKHVTIIDLCDEIKKRNFSPISDYLHEKISQTLEKNQQILLFLNKKGSATTIVCRECGEHLKCKNCLHRTSFYRIKNVLKCNRCHFEEPAPIQCPNCKSLSLKMLGFGTEKLEKEVQTLFPKANIRRIDTDTLASQKPFSQELSEKKETDIIIGTQLLLKEARYPNVGLITVVLADTAFAHHDFRSEERAFQTLTNLFLLKTGNPGNGEIVIQTYRPKNATLNFAITNDYEGFFKAVSASRRKFGYPPFFEMIHMTCENPSAEKNRKNAEYLKAVLEKLGKNEGTSEVKIALVSAMPPYRRGKFRHTLLLRGKNLHALIEKALTNGSYEKSFEKICKGAEIFEKTKSAASRGIMHPETLERPYMLGRSSRGACFRGNTPPPYIIFFQSKKRMIPPNWKIDVDPINI